MTTQKYSFVLLRGLVRETDHWGPFLGMLREAFPQSTVRGLDIPGAGIHYRRATPTSIEGIVQAMRPDLLKVPFDPQSPRVLIAVSLGGMIASQWFHDFPQDFHKSVLINTSSAQFSAPWKRLRPSALKQLLRVPLLKGIERERTILSIVSNRPDRYAEVARHWAHIHASRPVSKLNTLRQLQAAFRFEGPAGACPLPALLLNSAQDRMVDPECTRSMAHAWHAPLETHPTAGHDLTTDDPTWTVEKIKAWLSGLAAQSR